MLHNTGITAGVANNAALGVDGSQPVWLTLNQARERAFTGEIVFETDPEVHAYLDNGIVYYAERSSDASLGRRLLEAGVVDVEQLQRGTVRVGDVEHLGRLFDREPSVDRDAVIVMAETATEQLVTELANRSTASVRATAYRHHPSGVHRWFVTQTEPAPMARPVSTVAHYDSTVIDGLPSLPFADDDAAELIIEWDMELGHPTELRADVFDLSLDFTEYTGDPRDDDRGAVETVDDVNESAIDDLYIETIDDLYTETIDDPYVATIDVYVETIDDLYVETVDDLYVETVDERRESDTDEAADEFEFSVVWPDGSEEPAIRTAAIAEESTVSDVEWPDADETNEPVAGVEQPFRRSGDDDPEFAMPPLASSDEPEFADTEVPDEVADAVRRAIAAIESASVATSAFAPPLESTTELPVVAGRILGEPVSPPASETQADAFGGFAPPTMAMRAEVLYAQIDDDVWAGAEARAAVARSASPSSGTPTVFAADLTERNAGGDDERRSALRRLIGSLRRKDH
jgi:hypothetical protein